MKVTFLPPGPEDVHFQEYQFDSELGERQSIYKPLDNTMKVPYNQDLHDIIYAAIRKLGAALK